jgi:thiol-disulfide isomerase/thioredoxin
MRCTCVGIVLLLIGWASAQGLPKETPAAAFKALSDEYDSAYKEVVTRYRAVTQDDRIDEASRVYRQEARKLGTTYAGRFLELADKHGGDSVAVDALLRAVQVGGSTSPDAEKAFAHLARGHVRDARVQGILANVARSQWAAAEEFLRAVYEKNAGREARAWAGYWLANRLRQQAAEEPSTEKADKLSRESEALFRQVHDKYADVQDGQRGTLGQRVETGLTELRRLAVGQVAPEIDGEDADGKRFKLSDYRGKVVVLDFWGHWCPDCRAVYPRQRALVQRFAGKPFAILGINSDKDKDALKKTLEQRGVTWRYWFDGGSREGPIASAWNIQGWPTIYVLDERGVIRYKGHEELAEKLDKLVDELLKEMQTRGNGKQGTGPTAP